MKMHKILWALGLCCLVGTANAVEVEGVNVPDTASVGGTELVLNGAGVRKKAWVEVYVGALYLEQKTSSGEGAMAMGGPKRIAMHILYSFSQKKLIGAWEDGFKENNDKASYDAVKDRMATFNGFFGDPEEGDVFVFDYVPDTGTTVTINGEAKGTIEGADFNRALLAVFLGPEPPTDDLKEAMLGGE